MLERGRPLLTPAVPLAQAAELLEFAMRELLPTHDEGGGEGATGAGGGDGDGEGEVGLEAVLRAIEGGMLKVPTARSSSSTAVMVPQ